MAVEGAAYVRLVVEGGRRPHAAQLPREPAVQGLPQTLLRRCPSHQIQAPKKHDTTFKPGASTLWPALLGPLPPEEADAPAGNPTNCGRLCQGRYGMGLETLGSCGFLHGNTEEAFWAWLHSASVELSQAPSSPSQTLQSSTVQRQRALSAKDSIMPYGLQIVDTPGMPRAQETAGANDPASLRGSTCL